MHSIAHANSTATPATHPTTTKQNAKSMVVLADIPYSELNALEKYYAMYSHFAVELRF
jgi:hypothetical protein